MGEIVLYHGSGASDFQRVGPAVDAVEFRSLMFNVSSLLKVRGQTEAVDLLDAIPFSIYPAENHFNDEFHILHAELPLTEYEAVRVTRNEKRRSATLIAEAISEANGPYIRFVSVGLALADPDTWDVFLCHASEDKATVARPLYKHLEACGVRCWLDEAEIAWGESLISKIEDGIARARFVLVVLSPSFLQKPWATKELRSALAVELEAERSLVLPLLVGDPQHLLARQPFLKEKRYLIWNGEASVVEGELRALVRKQTTGRSPTVPSGGWSLDVGLQGEFDRLRRRVLHVGITNEIPGALRELRAFFVDQGLVDRPEYRPFFERWLSSPFVSQGLPVPNLLSLEKIRQMNEELRHLHV